MDKPSRARRQRWVARVRWKLEAHPGECHRLADDGELLDVCCSVGALPIGHAHQSHRRGVRATQIKVVKPCPGGGEADTIRLIACAVVTIRREWPYLGETREPMPRPLAPFTTEVTFGRQAKLAERDFNHMNASPA